MVRTPIEEVESNLLMEGKLFVIKDAYTGMAIYSAESEEETAEAVKELAGRTHLIIEGYGPGILYEDEDRQTPIVIHFNSEPAKA